MSAFVIDAFEFCRLQERAEGELPVVDLTRLANEAVDRAGVLHWSLVGAADKFGHPQLRLRVVGQINLVCQRCLGSMPFDMASESELTLAADDAAADAIEALIDDEDVDVIVADAAFDVISLIEDEALLALPLAPKHVTCPAQVDAVPVADEKVSPFSVLKKLKQ
jgi:uncharacterized protein